MRRANRTPMFRTYDDDGEEGYLLNAAGILKSIYFLGRDHDPDGFKTPEARAKVLRFKAKADAAIEAERILTGREPRLDDVLARAFRIDDFEAFLARVAEGREPSDGMIDFLLGGAPS